MMFYLEILAIAFGILVPQVIIGLSLHYAELLRTWVIVVSALAVTLILSGAVYLITTLPAP